ncbi:cation transporter [Sphingobacterium multivorum]|uniref:cation transporter n=1 Tax=Sphingobacterium multivorum TaxID=28454 RepID=UPI000DAFDB08|nr:cation transporter [Sphingobacterium multivorum]MBL7761313.1 heavy-metal-associated domain-containing protein [Sediminibacterium sp.]PZO34875.1 MAG: MerP protein [Flavobacteriaceae bacterium]
MKIRNILIAIIMLCTSNGLFAQNAPKTEKAIIKISINCDHCKMCETCGKLFQSELYSVKGLKRFDLNESEKTLTVYYSPKKTNLETIRTAISKLGYDADDVKAEPESYQKLDGCCKKKS